MKNRQWRVFAFREVDMSPTAASEMPSPIRNDALFQNSPHLSQYSRWIQWVSRHRAIPSDELRRNHTLEICHFAGPTRDVGSADHGESVAVVPRRCGFVEPWRRLDEGFTCAAEEFSQSPAGTANQQRHRRARANNSQRASVHTREPTRSPCGAGVATARLAVHFA